MLTYTLNEIAAAVLKYAKMPLGLCSGESNGITNRI